MLHYESSDEYIYFPLEVSVKSKLTLYFLNHIPGYTVNDTSVHISPSKMNVSLQNHNEAPPSETFLADITKPSYFLNPSFLQSPGPILV